MYTVHPPEKAIMMPTSMEKTPDLDRATPLLIVEGDLSDMVLEVGLGAYFKGLQSSNFELKMCDK